MEGAKKILVLFITFFCLINILNLNNSFADLESDIEFKADVSDENIKSAKPLKDIVGEFLGYLRVLSGLATVVIIATSGYRYIVATPDLKAQIKQEMFPIILGIIIIFGATSISAFILGAVGG